MRLPQQLQRAMAAEAEASREARAKVCKIAMFSVVWLNYITLFQWVLMCFFISISKEFFFLTRVVTSI